MKIQNKLYNNLQSGKITDENQILGLLNFRGNLQRGFEDENVAGTNNISPIDAFYTNTTAGQISAYENLNFEVKVLMSEISKKLNSKRRISKNKIGGKLENIIYSFRA